LNRSVVRYFVDGVGPQPENPDGHRVARSALCFIGPRRPARGLPSVDWRETISIVEVEPGCCDAPPYPSDRERRAWSAPPPWIEQRSGLCRS